VAKGGGNKSARIHVAGGKGSGGAQPWFNNNLRKARKRNKIAKADRKKNRNR